MLKQYTELSWVCQVYNRLVKGGRPVRVLNGTGDSIRNGTIFLKNTKRDSSRFTLMRRFAPCRRHISQAEHEESFTLSFSAMPLFATSPRRGGQGGVISAYGAVPQNR
jgi:hypothetical protein